MGNRYQDKMASNERTPLIATVRVAPPRQRYQHSTIRRFCSVAFGSTVLFVILFVLIPALFVPLVGHRPSHEPSKEANPITYKKLQEILLTTPSEEKAAEWSKYYTAGPHLAGQNLTQAVWTVTRWQEFGVLDTNIVSYDTYLNYPLSHRLALYEKTKSKNDKGDETASKKESWSIKFEASLEEDVLDEDPTTSLPNRIPTFHGYSASGNVTAPYVYVNYGTYRDFEDLIKANVSLEGKIAIAKYGGIFRGLKVKRAQDLGMIGAVIYTDPGDDGKYTDENGKDLYPKGPARNPSSVQRGSTQFLSVAPGDP
jgi:N-acetylated-alpha-linked acidic dipeptidase